MKQRNKSLEAALKILKKYGGILRYKDAIRYGIQPHLKAKGLK